MKEMYNNYDEEEDDWDLPEVKNNIFLLFFVFFLIFTSNKST